MGLLCTYNHIKNDIIFKNANAVSKRTLNVLFASCIFDEQSINKLADNKE